MLANAAHSSFALCNLGAADMRRVKDRLTNWLVAFLAADNDMVSAEYYLGNVFPLLTVRLELCAGK